MQLINLPQILTEFAIAGIFFFAFTIIGSVLLRRFAANHITAITSLYGRLFWSFITGLLVVISLYSIVTGKGVTINILLLPLLYFLFILEVNPDGSGERIYASGLRNPVGMDWAPGTQTLWTAVNERDKLGDELVPDYITGVREGGFYGWPYAYFGQHADPRMKDDPRPDLIAKAIVPDVALGSHTASLGLAFYNRKAFPSKYRNGVFVAQHGSWNRSTLAGYKVVFVPFTNGKPSGEPQDFLIGFIANISKEEVYGRPVGLVVLADGSMLVADDASNTIWRVSYKKQP